MLSGVESQMLRTYCTSEYLNINTRLNDPIGRFLKDNNLNGLRQKMETTGAKEELGKQRWGPTRVPVFNMLLTLIYMNPNQRESRLQMVEWLIKNASIPVDGTDLSGTSALMHSISTKPYLEMKFAELMYNAGADINRRNRFGATAAHDIAMLRPSTKEHELWVASALKWFVDHGGNVDIKEGDGLTARAIVNMLARFAPALSGVLAGGSSSASHNKAKKVGRNDS
ncbi:MAG: hypothetical protein M1828_005056 [Chrysothrix sp. TS-e1954]|nr:MAG: hypothetical protein M1828_005056 [Chrysothrix sp. TS-e1954]